MTALRKYASAFMIAVLVLTGHAMAEARTMTNAAGEMVLCTGTGPITILVDAEGKPTGPPHICPDCALALFADITPPFSMPESTLGETAPLRFTHVAELKAQRILAVSARGPPARV
ncbi:hypothetical protein [Lentibacter sp. XHP0401]|jgi:hypothetical protein|uniref:hypothetical protein n=1 Tax=Lentibacter sp. XHP0401 TaxID=2984334 RepID=UPI0021E82F7E|nr:hypothetical protein [Lentibacter sp. XHP0401]MCV2894386.1 hypothetical protein [Lentibacter sp. XHP0401]